MIECKCILPQFRHIDNPVFHKFIVYSIFKPGKSYDSDEDDIIEPKFAKCDFCDAIHRVYDICRSEILIDVEDVPLLSIDEIACGIPDTIKKILEQNSAPLHVWEEIAHLIESKQWNVPIIISRKEVKGTCQKKMIRIQEDFNVKLDVQLEHTVI